MGRRPRKSAAAELPSTKTAGAVVDGPTVDPVVGGSRSDADVYAGPGAESAHRSLDGGESAQRRDFGALDKILDAITPTLPLTYADAAVIFDLVRQYAPAPLIRDVMHDHRDIVVRIFDGKRQIYEHRLRSIKVRKP